MSARTDIKILDCTLRDGGYVNNFLFGQCQIRAIVECLCRARIDIIELGFLKNIKYDPEKSLFSTVSQAEALLEGLPLGQEYSLMIRPDWYDISQLEPCIGKIKKLRWAFHARDLDLVIRQVHHARTLGYEVYLNPVNVFSYSNVALQDMLRALNELDPSLVAIVDTHGSMMEEDLLDFHQVFDEILKPEIDLSIHLHENLSLAFSLAQKFISLTLPMRNCVVDSSLLGMGRIPGNLCTELIARYLNVKYDKSYCLSPIYDAIQHPIGEIKRELPWGYAPLYAETAFRKLHRSYAEYLIENTSLGVPEIVSVLEKIVEPVDREEFSQSLVDGLVARLNLSV